MSQVPGNTPPHPTGEEKKMDSTELRQSLRGVDKLTLQYTLNIAWKMQKDAKQSLNQAHTDQEKEAAKVEMKSGETLFDLARQEASGRDDITDDELKWMMLKAMQKAGEICSSSEITSAQ